MTNLAVTLDAWHKNHAIVGVNQGEVDARFLEITLTEKGTAFDLTGKTVLFYTAKPDKNVVFKECSVVDAQNGVIKVELTSQMVAVAGTVICEVHVVTSQNQTLKFEGLRLCVRKMEDSDGALESSSEFTLLCKSIDKAVEAAENANNSAQNADEATERANASADKADEAAESANTAATNANNAKNAANTAAQNADEAASKANTAAQSATEAAEAANTATEAANVAKNELLSEKYIKGITGSGTVIQPSSQQIVNITPANIGAVPTTRTVNGKALSSNITLGASDVGALPDTTAIPTKTSELENDSKFIDNKATGSTSIAIGATSTQNYSTLIGTESSCTGQYSTAVGRKTASVQYGSSLGYGSKANGSYSVALGYYSTATEASVVSVGDGSTSSSYGKRRIINVKDPTNAQDAATKNYVDTIVGTLNNSLEARLNGN